MLKTELLTMLMFLGVYFGTAQDKIITVPGVNHSL